jgi:hypothetical protein
LEGIILLAAHSVLRNTVSSEKSESGKERAGQSIASEFEKSLS